MIMGLAVRLLLTGNLEFIFTYQAVKIDQWYCMTPVQVGETRWITNINLFIIHTLLCKVLWLFNWRHNWRISFFWLHVLFIDWNHNNIYFKVNIEVLSLVLFPLSVRFMRWQEFRIKAETGNISRTSLNRILSVKWIK